MRQAHQLERNGESRRTHNVSHTLPVSNFWDRPGGEDNPLRHGGGGMERAARGLSVGFGLVLRRTVFSLIADKRRMGMGVERVWRH